MHHRNLRGLLADNNLEGHIPYLRSRIEKLGLWDLNVALQVDLKTFTELKIDKGLDDRTLWQFCQTERYVLMTDNRSRKESDSLEATLRDSWQEGHLPVITIGSKEVFEHDPDYARRSASDIVEILFGIAVEQKYCDQRRIWVPF